MSALNNRILNVQINVAFLVAGDAILMMIAVMDLMKSIVQRLLAQSMNFAVPMVSVTCKRCAVMAKPTVLMEVMNLIAPVMTVGNSFAALRDFV